MCGPLACAGVGTQNDRRRRTIFAYHAARVGGYALLGGLLGTAGGGVARALSVSVQPIAPWLMAAALVASALELGKRLAPLPGVSRIARGATLASRRLPPTARAAVVGAVTPLLPCGLLYGMFAAVLATGSFAWGALTLGTFALGAVPALLVAQLQAGLLRRKPGAAAFLLRRALPVLAAAVLVYRALAAGDAAAAGTPPSCH